MPKPIPVLFLIQHLVRGGTELHLFDLVTHLDRSRFEPHVGYFNGGAISDALEARADLHIWHTPVRRAYDRQGLAAIWKVRRYLDRHRIPLLVTFHFVADFIGTLAAAATPTRVISSRRDMGFTRKPRQKRMGHYLDWGVDRYIAVSEAVGEAIAREERLPREKIVVIHNGIDLEALRRRHWEPAAERRSLGISEDEIVIGCVSNFNPVKGHLTLLDAFARLCARRSGHPLKLLLTGDGPMRPAIEARIAELGLGREVILTGTSQAVAREFLVSDLAVLPSETEGFSNSIIQAMALERAVVACRVGGNPEAIVDGQTGLLVPPRDAGALAEALGRLIDDPEARRRMAAAAARRAGDLFSRAAMMEKTQSLFAQVLDGRKS